MKMSWINLKHFRRKLFSLALAIILWFFVTENNVIVDQKTVDIDYRGIPDNVIVVESLQKLSYTISKNPYYPTEIKSTVKPYVDVENATPGWHSFPILFDISPPLPAYANIHPNVTTARILLDNRSAKSVLIKPDINLSNPQDFSITDIRVSPEITQISGPESTLENVKNIFLNPTTITQPGDYKLDARVIPPANNVSVQDTKVSLQFSVKSSFQTASLQVPITHRNLSPNLRLITITPDTIELRIRGVNSKISALKDNLKSLAYIDLLKVESRGVYPKVLVKLDIPEGITILNPKNIPSSVDVSIDEAPLAGDKENAELTSTPSTPDESSKDEIFSSSQAPAESLPPVDKEDSPDASKDLTNEENSTSDMTPNSENPPSMDETHSTPKTSDENEDSYEKSSKNRENNP